MSLSQLLPTYLHSKYPFLSENTPLSTPQKIHVLSEHLSALHDYFIKYHFLTNYAAPAHVTHFFARRDYETRLTQEWRNDLDGMTLSELIRMAADDTFYWESSEGDSWCPSLLEFLKTTRELAFHRKRVVRDEETGEERKVWLLYLPPMMSSTSSNQQSQNNSSSIEQSDDINNDSECSCCNHDDHTPFHKYDDERQSLISHNQLSTRTSAAALYDLFTKQQRADMLLYKGMNPKKVLEVTLLARLIAATSQSSAIDNIIDIGSGKGYLSHILAVQYDMKVIGIDSNEHVAECANEKAKEYVEVVQRAKERKENPNLNNRSNKRRRRRNHREERKSSNGWLRSLCSHIDSNMQCSDFLKIVGDENLFEDQKTLLIGLHTCGNLASTTLKLFVNSEAEAVVNVGCCYHKLLEKGDVALHGDEERIGFPLSSHVKSFKYRFTTGARDLGCLALSQWDWVNVEQSVNVFKMQSYRWVLDEILLSNGCKPAGGLITSVFTVGALPSIKCSRFGLYCHAACEKMLSKGNITAPQPFVDQVQNKDQFISDMDAYYKTFKPDEKEDYIHSVAVWWSLRAVMSSLVEEMVLLDRVLYLLEKGCEAELVRLFPPDVSPRGYVIVGRKPDEAKEE